MRRLLFIGHDGGRTGAPLVLLYLLRWLRSTHPELMFDVMLLRGGELETEYREVATELFVVPAESRTLAARAARKIRREFGAERRLWPPHVEPLDRRYDLVFGNTVVTLEYLRQFKRKGSRTVCWAHEMTYVIGSFYSPERFRELAADVDLFLPSSGAVETALADNGVTAPMKVVYDFIQPLPAFPTERAAIRRELGFSGDSFLVAACGSVEWRKGPDLFLQIAAAAVRAEPSLRFMWVGGAPAGSDDGRRLLHDIDRSGLGDVVKVTGFAPDPARYFAAADVFALTSREDPFPLVCLEAANLGKPVICFAGGGGMPEFVGEDAGKVVPYGDTAAFANAIVSYRRDAQKLTAAGTAARERVSSTFSLEASCRRMAEILLNDGA